MLTVTLYYVHGGAAYCIDYIYAPFKRTMLVS